VVPAFGAEPWAEAWGVDPIEALTVALAETLTDPPPAKPVADPQRQSPPP